MELSQFGSVLSPLAISILNRADMAEVLIQASLSVSGLTVSFLYGLGLCVALVQVKDSATLGRPEQIVLKGKVLESPPATTFTGYVPSVGCVGEVAVICVSAQGPVAAAAEPKETVPAVPNRFPSIVTEVPVGPQSGAIAHITGPGVPPVIVNVPKLLFRPSVRSICTSKICPSLTTTAPVSTGNSAITRLTVQDEAPHGNIAFTTARSPCLINLTIPSTASSSASSSPASLSPSPKSFPANVIAWPLGPCSLDWEEMCGL